MPTIVLAPTVTFASRTRRAVSDRTVALAFAIVPLIVFALAVVVFGLERARDMALAVTD